MLRNSILQSGVFVLRSEGYSNVNEDNIMVESTYCNLFKRILVESRPRFSHNPTVTKELNEMIKEIENGQLARFK